MQRTQVQELGGAGLAGHGERRATAMAAQLARGRTREGEVRVNTPGLTARSKSSSVVSGRRRRQQIDRGDRRTDAAMKAAGTTLRCTRRHVSWWRQRGRRGGSSGSIGEARGGRWPRWCSSARARLRRPWWGEGEREGRGESEVSVRSGRHRGGVSRRCAGAGEGRQAWRCVVSSAA